MIYLCYNRINGSVFYVKPLVEDNNVTHCTKILKQEEEEGANACLILLKINAGSILS